MNVALMPTSVWPILYACLIGLSKGQSAVEDPVGRGLPLVPQSEQRDVREAASSTISKLVEFINENVNKKRELRNSWKAEPEVTSNNLEGTNAGNPEEKYRKEEKPAKREVKEGQSPDGGRGVKEAKRVARDLISESMERVDWAQANPESHTGEEANRCGGSVDPCSKMEKVISDINPSACNPANYEHNEETDTKKKLQLMSSIMEDIVAKTGPNTRKEFGLGKPKAAQGPCLQSDDEKLTQIMAYIQSCIKDSLKDLAGNKCCMPLPSELQTFLIWMLHGTEAGLSRAESKRYPTYLFHEDHHRLQTPQNSDVESPSANHNPFKCSQISENFPVASSGHQTVISKKVGNFNPVKESQFIPIQNSDQNYFRVKRAADERQLIKKSSDSSDLGFLPNPRADISSVWPDWRQLFSDKEENPKSAIPSTKNESSISTDGTIVDKADSKEGTHIDYQEDSSSDEYEHELGSEVDEAKELKTESLIESKPKFCCTATTKRCCLAKPKTWQALMVDGTSNELTDIDDLLSPPDSGEDSEGETDEEENEDEDECSTKCNKDKTTKCTTKSTCENKITKCTTKSACDDLTTKCTTKSTCEDKTTKCTTKSACDDLTTKCTTKSACDDLTTKCTTKSACDDLSTKCSTKSTCEGMTTKCTTKSACDDLTTKCTTKSTDEDMASKCTAKSADEDMTTECTTKSFCEDTTTLCTTEACTKSTCPPTCSTTACSTTRRAQQTTKKKPRTTAKSPKTCRTKKTTPCPKTTKTTTKCTTTTESSCPTTCDQHAVCGTTACGTTACKTSQTTPCVESTTECDSKKSTKRTTTETTVGGCGLKPTCPPKKKKKPKTKKPRVNRPPSPTTSECPTTCPTTTECTQSTTCKTTACTLSTTEEATCEIITYETTTCEAPKTSEYDASKTITCGSSTSAYDASKTTTCGTFKTSAYDASQKTTCDTSKSSGNGASQTTECDNSKSSGNGASQTTECDNSKSSGNGASQTTECDNSKSSGNGASRTNECDSSGASANGASDSAVCDASRTSAYDASKTTTCETPKNSACDGSKTTACDASKTSTCDATKTTTCENTASKAGACTTTSSQLTTCEKKLTCSAVRIANKKLSMSVPLTEVYGELEFDDKINDADPQPADEMDDYINDEAELDEDTGTLALNNTGAEEEFIDEYDSNFNDVQNSKLSSLCSSTLPEEGVNLQPSNKRLQSKTRGFMSWIKLRKKEETKKNVTQSAIKKEIKSRNRKKNKGFSQNYAKGGKMKENGIKLNTSSSTKSGANSTNSKADSTLFTKDVLKQKKVGLVEAYPRTNSTGLSINQSSPKEASKEDKMTEGTVTEQRKPEATGGEEAPEGLLSQSKKIRGFASLFVRSKPSVERFNSSTKKWLQNDSKSGSKEQTRQVSLQSIGSSANDTQDSLKSPVKRDCRGMLKGLTVEGAPSAMEPPTVESSTQDELKGKHRRSLASSTFHRVGASGHDQKDSSDLFHARIRSLRDLLHHYRQASAAGSDEDSPLGEYGVEYDPEQPGFQYRRRGLTK